MSIVELEHTLAEDMGVAIVDDGAETEDVENDGEEDLPLLGKRLHEDDDNEFPQGKRLRGDLVDVIDLGEDDDDDDDDDNEQDDEDDNEDSNYVVSASPHRPFSKNDAKNFNMKNAKAPGAGYTSGQTAPLSTHSPSLQRLLDTIDRKTKMELFSDAFETYGDDLFQGHESWRDQLLIKACRLDPSFVTTITDLARPNGAYNSVLSGEEEEAEDDEDEDEDDDDGTSSVEIIEQEVTPSCDDDDDELNLVSGDDDTLGLDDLTGDL
ncbi:hypothetical protein ACHHYP_01029 [Achlya hypogyna]|uniref:Uncharacterized protein n=1 Tax=Achlya hypogyna TaxID=1202772 RepID=A0A1V9Z9L2_ACHHY|nr:hypothetical protein ACHHYP_01029 [Achlya hypogyna]